MKDTKHTPRGGFWVVGQFVLMAVIVVAGQLTDGHFTKGVLTMSSAVLLGLGAVVFGWRGFVNLGRNLTAFPKPLDDGELVTTGVYAIVRHPIYTSVLSGCVGYVLWSGSWFAAIMTLVLCVWFEYKSRAEERFLHAKFPAYAAYARTTKKFIPYMY